MTQKDFFTSYQIRKKFDSKTITGVRGFMARNGLLPNYGGMTPESAAAFIVLASCTATKADLDSFGLQLLEVSTDPDTPETVQKVLSLSLSDPLRAATFERIIFDRMTSKVILEFIDGDQIPVELGVPIQSDWKAPGGVAWKQVELVSIASDLQQEYQEGEILSDSEFEQIVKEHDKENFNDN